MTITELPLSTKVKCKICPAWNCEIPKNLPKWLSDLWVDKNKIWFEADISFTEIIELYNLGIDVMLSRTFEGQIRIALNKTGFRFGMR